MKKISEVKKNLNKSPNKVLFENKNAFTEISGLQKTHQHLQKKNVHNFF